MNLSRFSFLRGLSASLGFGVVGGRRIFAAPAVRKQSGVPNLVLGVVSDTHMMTDRFGKAMHKDYSDRHFIAALKHFRDANVDAVVHLGDMANIGQVEAMQFHADAWHKVFPFNRGRNGQEVVKLFVTGNHDVEGHDYGNNYVKALYKTPAERAKHVLAIDIAAHWRRIWGEPYAPVWHKEVKSYHFFGWNWGVDAMEAASLVNGHSSEIGPAEGPKPFFCLSHGRPLYDFRKALRAYSNAVALFGHCHISAANWNTIYMYNEGVETFPSIQCPPCTAPNWPVPLGEDEYAASSPLEGKEAAGIGRQGFVVRLYDDMMVVERREFSKGGSLGADWIMPLGQYDPHPFTKGELKKRIGEPQFKTDAKLAVRRVVLSSPKKDIAGGKRASTPDKMSAVKVTIPPADANPDSRAYVYDVEVCGDMADTPKLHKSVYAAGCNMGIGHETNGGITTLTIPASELPPGGSLTFAVRPLTSLGTFGRSIAAVLKNQPPRKGKRT